MGTLVLGAQPRQNIPITVLLKLNKALKKSLFSRNFYLQINDKVLSQTATLDSTLYFICYFTLLLSAVLNNKHKILAFVKGQNARLIKVMGSFLPPKAGRVLSPEQPDASASGNEKSEPDRASENAAQETPSQLAVHLKAVSSYISDVRIFNRLVEAIKYMPWIIDEFSALANPVLAVPRTDRLVNFAQAINCLTLELFENVGWLSDHNWIGTSDNNYWCIESYIWSSRVWGAYIVVEMIELFRRHPASRRGKDWKISLFKQAVQLPLVLHWSLYDGCLSPFWVGLCGTGASWFGFKSVMESIDLA
ncbi:hypothetical protein METBIDRAFT_37511 [Metschnikowia bicuspidata var. bicuspidata NRRL YB-4993]|uniref:Uncharacterized protein n=1 Tax=Metschnikowia bicuspidata var. bicuspidata NRRL YB-4993 TaxID=869754 RepID=A0A1A0HK64_9ASCO|nr:hypothetical protein METBIDRAFT_37511 [Metschnikowia bicuspidata var. bicuspidata NRRL YB-4993]OBA24193.1 hypothetical protein METBIDRAFT_37511 [Metschnikowia bicuspidata var. bicuspidata NRRL YB-4993]